MERGGAEPLEGDVALANMLLGDGYIMNGGLEHFEDLSDEEQRESISGFRFFSFNDTADLILKAPTLTGGDLDDARNAFIEFDSGMIHQVRAYIEANTRQSLGP